MEVIEPTQTKWASPISFGPKKYGTLSFCVDYRKMNAGTIGNSYEILQMDTCTDWFGDAMNFSMLDANKR